MKRLIFIPILILVLLISGCGERKTDLPMSTTYEVDTTGGFQFAFHYENEEPKLEFVSPSGIVYTEGSKDLTVERATQVSGLKSVYYLFSKGEIGEWKINYDKFSNESVEFYYSGD